MPDHTPLRRLRRPALAVLVPLVLAACAAGSAPGDDADASRRPTRSEVPVQPVPSESADAVVGEVPPALLEQILTNAADRGDVDIEEVEVLRAESVTWNDGSLGCPEPGMMYTQALVDGYHVVVEAGGMELDYRATTNGDYLLCEDGGTPSGG